jgi:two-component sensor histidine kinase
VDLNPGKTLLVAMLLHELGTNAVKYGALSNDRGRVDLTWDSQIRDSRQLLRLHWKESGGPPVARPTRKGFGTRMIERSLRAEGGSAGLEFDPGGLVCEIEVRL